MKKLFILFALVLSNIFFAQNITFIYQLRYKPNLNKDSLITRDYYLDVLGKQSVFRSDNDRRSDSLVEKTGYGLGRNPLFVNQIYIQKNLVTMNITKTVTTLFNDNYLIKINDQLHWQILPEKIDIGDWSCQKATVLYGGREWTAWFTQSIPLQEGPYVFNGLPGMIVRISDRLSDYEFALIKTKRSDKNNMFALRKGKEISLEAFNKIQANYYNDPYAEIKARNIKFQVGDANGNIIPTDMNTLTKNLRKQIKENNNPIEISQKIDYQ